MQDFFTIFSDFISIFETFFRSGKLLKIDALYDPWVLYKVFHSITCTRTPPYRELLRVPPGMDFDFRHYPDLGSDTSSVWNFCSRFSDVTFAGKPVVASRNVGCFLRLSWVSYEWKCHIWCAYHGRKALRAKVRWWLILTLYWWDLFVLGTK